MTPPELLETITGPKALAPGRALDLGCGTGTNALFLAQHGWKVVGIDFVDQAIRKARKKAARAEIQARFFAGDVTRLDQMANLVGSFDLILDIGCFHSLSEEGQKRYACGVKKRLRSEGTFLLYAWRSHRQENGAVSKKTDKIADVFEPDFRVEAVQIGEDRGRPSAWYWFRKMNAEN